MESKKHITVIGATGNLGAPVVKNLLSFGYSVKAIVRNQEKARHIFSGQDNIELYQADLQDVNSLENALKGTEFLYLNLATETLNLEIPFAPDREGIANILKAVDRSAIVQIISISGMGAFDNIEVQPGSAFVPNIIRKQGQKLLKESGIPYTILHCTWFLDSFVFYRRSGVYSIIGSTTNPIWFTNAFEFSCYLDAAVDNKEAFYREFPIQGREAYTHPAAAVEFLSVYSKETKVKALPYWIISFMSLFNSQMKYLKHMAKYFSVFREEYIADSCNTSSVLGEFSLTPGEYAQKLTEENFYNYL